MNTKTKWLGAAAVVIVCAAGYSFWQKDTNTVTTEMPAAAQVTESAQKVVTVEGVTEYRLANGLRVLLFPDSSKPTITVNMTYLVGSRHEGYGETGMAHLLEHLMFKGSKNYPEPTKEFTRRGFKMNGSTWLDRTNYFVSFNAVDDNLDWALGWSADAMVNSFIAQKDLDTEMTVVRNEYEMGENNPVSVLLKRMQSVLFDWHNYGNSTIGARSDIEHVKIENLQTFYHRYYQPDNAVLMVSGKFDEAETLKKIERIFGAIPKPTRELPKLWTEEPVADGPRTFEIRRAGEMTVVSVGYRIPAALHPDAQLINLGADVLGDTPRGRLHKALVETGLATQVFAWPMPAHDPGLAMFGAMLPKGGDIEKAKQVLIETVESTFETEPLKADDLSLMAREEKTLYERTFADPENFGVDISDFIALGDWRLFFIHRDSWEKMRPEDVMAAWKRYFVRDNRVVGTFIPDNNPQRAQMTPAPTLDEVISAYKFKEQGHEAEAFDSTPANLNARTERFAIGDVQVALLPKKTRGETVVVRTQFRYGNMQSRSNKRAIAALMGSMLERGTKTMTREEINDAFTKFQIEGDLGQFTTTREHLADALDLMAKLWTESTMPEKDFEELKAEFANDVQSRMDDPRIQARDAITEYFNHYEKTDPRYRLTSKELKAAIEKATLDEVKEYYADQFGLNRGEVAIVGDFDAKAVKAQLEKILKEKASKVPYERIIRKHFDTPGTRIIIDTPDKENATIVARFDFAQNKGEPDSDAMLLANWIFGGSTGLSNRLMLRLRQKDGLSYGAGSNVNIPAFGNDASWTMQAILAPQNLRKAELALYEEIDRVIKDGFTQEELDEAKKGFIEYRAVNRSQDNLVAYHWVQMMNEGLDWTEAEDRDTTIRNLTLEEVNAAFRKMVNRDQLTVVLAGDQKKAMTQE